MAGTVRVQACKQESCTGAAPPAPCTAADTDAQSELLQMSIKLLMEAARDWAATQFILLTPQDVKAIAKAEADVRQETFKNTEVDLPDYFVTIQQMHAARVDRAAAE